MKRFQGAKTTTWTRSRNQIGPDDAVGTAPDGTAYPVERTTQRILRIGTITSTDTDTSTLIIPWEDGATDGIYVDDVVYLQPNFVTFVSGSTVDTGVSITLTLSGSRAAGSAAGNIFVMYSATVAGELTTFVKKSISSAGVYFKTTIQDAIDTAVSSGFGFVTILDSGVYEERLELKGKTVQAASGFSPTIKYPADAGVYFKTTIQDAIDTAVSGGFGFVTILDSGVYEERLDLKGKTVQAASGFSPTIKYPADGWTGSADIDGQAVTEFAEFTRNGIPVLFASTSGNGLYVSTNGMAFTSDKLAGKDLRGCVVWDDGTGPALYIANYTDNLVQKVDDSGNVTTFASGGSIISGATNPIAIWVSNNGLGVTFQNTTATPDTYANIVFSSSSSYSTFDGLTQEVYFPRKTVKTNRTALIRSYISGGIESVEYVLYVLGNTGNPNSGGSIGIYDEAQISPVDICLHHGIPYAIDASFLYFLPNITTDPTRWERRSAHGVTNPSALVEDPRGWLYVLGSGGNYAISRDSGASWYTYGASPVAKSGYAPAAFFRGVGLVSGATDAVYEDMVHFRDSVGGGGIEGAYCIGRKSTAQALEVERIASAEQAMRYCDISDYYQMTHEVNQKRLILSSSRVHDMVYGAIGIQYLNTGGSGNIIYDIAGVALSYDAPDDDTYDCTITRCGIGIDKSGNNYGVDECIVYGNGVDMYTSIPANISPVRDSVVGTIIGTNDIIQTTSSRSNPFLLSNGDVKDKSAGYGFDSVALALNAGAYKITRTSSSAYAVDQHIKYLPTGETIVWNVSNFSSNENADGEYSETWDGLRRRIELAWDAAQFADAKQLYALMDVYGREDAVYRYGDSDGTNWIPLRSGTIDSETDSTITVSDFATAFGKNQYKGYWILLDGTYYRILGNTEGDAGDNCTITIDGTHTAEVGEAYSIDFILVKIDKSQALQATQYLTNSRVVTGYSLTLREVDSE